MKHEKVKTEEPQKHYAKFKKLHIQSYIFHYFVYAQAKI